MMRETFGYQLDFTDSVLQAETREGLTKVLGSRFGLEWSVGHALSPEGAWRYASGSS
jgi:hypothetical protein